MQYTLAKKTLGLEELKGDLWECHNWIVKNIM